MFLKVPRNPKLQFRIFSSAGAKNKVPREMIVFQNNKFDYIILGGTIGVGLHLDTWTKTRDDV